jgi:hypothetical protein
MNERDIMDLKKRVAGMVSEAIEKTFNESLIYGVGFLRVTTDGGKLEVQHVPFAELDIELEKVLEHKKLMARN